MAKLGGAVKRALALQNGPSILVGHSYGGAVITEAGETPTSWVLAAESDRTINPELERWYASRAKSHAVEVPVASHAVYSLIRRKSRSS